MKTAVSFHLKDAFTRFKKCKQKKEGMEWNEKDAFLKASLGISITLVP